MKKPLRILLIVVAAFVVVIVVVIALAFTSGVQTWAAHKFAPATPELTVGIGRVDAGLNKTRVENIRVVQPGLVLTIPLAEVDVNIKDAAGSKIVVKRLVAKGWILDMTQPVAAPTGTTSAKSGSSTTTTADAKNASAKNSAVSTKPEDAAKTAFDGIFKLIQLPFDLAVDGVDLSGEILLPSGRAQVSITGGAIAAGSDGKFALVADYKAIDSTTVAVRGDITARMDTPRTFERFGVNLSAAATSPQLPAGAKIDVVTTAAREAQGEAYTVAVRSGSRDLVNVDIKLPPGTAPLTGNWKVDAVTADVAPFVAGQKIPDFVAKGQGTFSTDRAFAQVKTAGKLDVALDKLDSVQPEFAALGRLTLAANFDASTQGDLASLNTLDIRVSSATAPIISIAAAQAIQFNTATSELKAANPAGDLVRITINGLPLAWAKPFLGDIALTGDNVRGEFVASAHDGGFSVRPVAPITLTNFSASQAGVQLVRALDISLAAQADYAPKGWTAEVTNLSVASAGAQLLKLSAKASQDTDRTDQPLKAEGKYEISLPAVLAQPVAANSIALRRGLARGDFSASVAKLQSANFTLQLADLVAADATSSALPGVALTARADIDASGKIIAKIPVEISYAGRKTDITLAATVSESGKEKNIDAQLTGDLINVQDLMAFSAISPAAPAAQPGTTTPKPVVTKPSTTPSTTPAPTTPAPTVPVWAGTTGELKIAFKKVVYSPEVQASDVGGSIKITPTALTLENIRGALNTGGALKASGGLQFEAKTPQPYALKADLALTDVEPAPILRALSPGKPPVVDGKFDLTTQVSGRAVDPAAFSDVIGDIKLIGKNGTLNALNAKTSSKITTASRAASIAGLAGSFFGNDVASKYADQARAAADVINTFTAIKFDQLQVIVARDDQNNLAIKDLSLSSAFMKLAGTGQITYQPGVPLMQQPLLATLQLAAKGTLGNDLRTLGLLKAEADASGFATMADNLKLDGTLQSVGTQQIQNLIEKAVTR